jgi:hypothetical protein
MDLIQVVQNKAQFRDLVTTIGFDKMQVIIWPAERLSAFEDVVCPLEIVDPLLHPNNRFTVFHGTSENTLSILYNFSSPPPPHTNQVILFITLQPHVMQL